jgi:RNA polymerase sigma factor (sigma-70 family)
MAAVQLGAVLRYIRSLDLKSSQQTDGALLRAFVESNDQAAFEALLRRHGPMVLRVCARSMGNLQDAEDALQATFLLLAQRAGSIRKQESLASWLHGVAYRMATHAKRAAARRRKHESQVRRPEPQDPALRAAWQEIQVVLDEEIERLPESFRGPFVLCCLENKSNAEAARQLGLTETTVGVRLSRARKLLQQRLTRRGVSLTAVLAVIAISPQSLSATLSRSLVGSTTKAAVQVALGQRIACGLVSAKVATLVKGVNQTMFLTKVKTAVLLLLCAVSVTGGSGLAALCCTGTDGQPPAQQVPQEAAGVVSKQERRHSAETAAKAEADDVIKVRGQVLDPDGKPLAGARLYVGHSGPDARLDAVGTTDAEGRFRVAVRRPNPDAQTYLLSHAAGFGVDWVDLSAGKWPAEVTLRLPKDVPITGRIVNTEGRPLVGVSVSITGIYVPANEKLDEYVKGGPVIFFDKVNYRTPKQLRVPLDGVTGKVTTDRDGRFHIGGAGRERIVRVTISGSGVVRSTLQVITCPGFDAEPFNTLVRKSYEGREPIWLAITNQKLLYPPALEFVADAGNTIEGTVMDAASGKPIPGCRISGSRWGSDPDTVTVDVSGTRGEYRLEGLSKIDTVFIRPPKDSLYLSRRVEVAYTARQPKVRLDIELAKGALVIGRVVDKQTGKGVQGNIRFSPLADNRFYGSKPGFDQRSYDYQETDKDGRFRRVTIPGQSIVLFWMDHHHEEKFNGQDLCVYRGAVPDPDHNDIFQPAGVGDQDRWLVRKADSNAEQIPGNNNAVKVIDAKEDGETRVELFVDRGATARIAVQDADGKPLTGAWAGGLTDCYPFVYQLPEATATVYALNPDKPRAMAFFHAEKKLGGTVTVRGNEKGPVVVKLAPLGHLSGRLLDADGNPLEGVEVSLSPETRSGGELYRVAAPPSSKPVRTNKHGRFHIEGVVPGLKFLLLLRGQIPYYPPGGVAVKQVQVKPGEKLDLGDVRIGKPGT